MSKQDETCRGCIYFNETATTVSNEGSCSRFNIVISSTGSCDSFESGALEINDNPDDLTNTWYVELVTLRAQTKAMREALEWFISVAKGTEDFTDEEQEQWVKHELPGLVDQAIKALQDTGG